MYQQHTCLSSENVCIEFEGKPLNVPRGISVAAAVLGHSSAHDCRCSTFRGEARAPFCLIGVCHECLMEINGRPYQQACMIMVEEGMTVKKQQIRGGV